MNFYRNSIKCTNKRCLSKHGSVNSRIGITIYFYCVFTYLLKKIGAEFFKTDVHGTDIQYIYFTAHYISYKNVLNYVFHILYIYVLNEIVPYPSGSHVFNQKKNRKYILQLHSSHFEKVIFKRFIT